jgi:hypothetical protein
MKWHSIVTLLTIVLSVIYSIFSATLLLAENSPGHSHHDSADTLKIYQFDNAMLPRIDGDPSDWGMVPHSYRYGTEMLMYVERDWNRDGMPAPVDTSDFSCSVTVGWSAGMNALYFLYEAYDDYWDFREPGQHNDMFEICLDADCSGGEFVFTESGSRVRAPNSHAQAYHIFTPSEGKSDVYIWNCPAWIGKPPYSLFVCKSEAGHGESGRLVMECMITPFDLVTYDGPRFSAVSELTEGEVIGLSWLIADWDGPGKTRDLPCLSHDIRMVHNADFLRPFLLMPKEKGSEEQPEAYFTFSIISHESKTVAFTDRSTGDIASRQWDFGDGATANSRHPVHSFDDESMYRIVTLTVTGPRGTDTYEAVCEVLFKP